jgi:hypothetical protein
MRRASRVAAMLAHTGQLDQRRLIDSCGPFLAAAGAKAPSRG